MFSAKHLIAAVVADNVDNRNPVVHRRPQCLESEHGRTVANDAHHRAMGAANFMPRVAPMPNPKLPPRPPTSEPGSSKSSAPIRALRTVIESSHTSTSGGSAAAKLYGEAFRRDGRLVPSPLYHPVEGFPSSALLLGNGFSPLSGRLRFRSRHPFRKGLGKLLQTAGDVSQDPRRHGIGTLNVPIAAVQMY